MDGVVGIGVNGDILEIFIQDIQGKITSRKQAFHPWILTDRQQKDAWHLLDGPNHYKYIKRCNDKAEFWNNRRDASDHFAVYHDLDSAMMVNGINTFRGLTPDQVSVLSIDIEATTLELSEKSRVLLVSNTFKQGMKVIHKLFAYDEYSDQGEMLKAWTAWVREVNPSIITGHNILNYDLPYLAHVAKLAGIDLRVGKDRSAIEFDKFTSQFRRDGSQSYSYRDVNIYGRSIVDTFFLSIKSDVSRKRENYQLKTIIKEEGLERKDRQFYEAALIGKNYRDPIEWPKIKEYCRHDSMDALALYERMIPPYFYLCRTIPRTLQRIVNTATGSQINSYLCSSYLAVGHSLPKASETFPYEGAISIGKVGLYRNIYKVDVASLYPNIMLEFGYFDKTKDPLGHFIRMLRDLTEERLRNKELYKQTGQPEYQALSESQKLVVNSAYGFMGAPGLNFNSPENAALVTKKGREILTQAMEWAGQRGFIIVNADTDSIAFTKGDQSFITETERLELLSDLNSLFPKRIRFENDGYFESGLVIKAKNYVFKQRDKLVVKGSALKSSNREPALRELLRRTVITLLEGSIHQVADLRAEYLDEIDNITDIKRWASKKTVTAKMLNPARTQEANIHSAIHGSNYHEGDKVYLYYTATGSLKVAEKWAQDHCKKRLREKLKNAMKILEAVL